eukprot:1137837-Pelagomonas_calceolata.AAC.4
MQPPSADDLAASRAAAHQDSLSGPIGTGNPAGAAVPPLCIQLCAPPSPRQRIEDFRHWP